MDEASLPLPPATVYLNQLEEVERLLLDISGVQWKWRAARDTDAQADLPLLTGDSLAELRTRIQEAGVPIASIGVDSAGQAADGGGILFTADDGVTYIFWLRLGISLKTGKQSYVAFNPEQGHSVETAGTIARLLREHPRKDHHELVWQHRGARTTWWQRNREALSVNVVVLFVGAAIGWAFGHL